MLSITEHVIVTQVGHSSLLHSDLTILITDQLGRSLICLHGAGQVSSTWTPKDGELDTQMCPCSPGTLTTLALCVSLVARWQYLQNPTKHFAVLPKLLQQLAYGCSELFEARHPEPFDLIWEIFKAVGVGGL